VLAPYPGLPHTIISSHSELFNLLPRPKGARLVSRLSLHPLANPQGLDYGYVERLVCLILQEVLKLINHYSTPLLNGGPHRILLPLLIYSLAGLVP